MFVRLSTDPFVFCEFKGPLRQSLDVRVGQTLCASPAVYALGRGHGRILGSTTRILTAVTYTAWVVRYPHLISDGGLYAALVTYTSESLWLAAERARELLDGLSRLLDLLDRGVRCPRDDGLSVVIVYSDRVLWLSSPA